MNIYHIRETLRMKSIYDVDLRVVYYARVSTDKEEQKNSIKNQRDHFEELITSNGHWVFSGGYIDDGISGIHAEKREQFQKMIRDAKSGKFDLIITKEISRFARNTLDSIQYTRELLRYGVCVWFQNDNINTVDEDSEFRLTIMAGVAQDEIRKLSSRVRFGHAQSIKNGVVLGNSHIYGYNKDKGRLTINKEEATMVKLIFERYATGEWTTPKLEKLLYDMGYTNYKGGKISRRVIQNIITNPKYKGWYAGGKVKIVDMFTKKQEFLPEEEWNLFKDDGSRVPAIVSEEVWELANRHLRKRSETIKSHRTSFKDGNLFTGKIYCSNDGAAYWMKQHHIRGKEDVRWVCSHRIKNGAESCNSFGLSELELKIMLADIIQKSAPCIDVIAETYISIFDKILTEKENNRDVEIEGLKARIQNVKSKMEKLLDYNLSGAIPDEEFIRRNSEYGNQIEEMNKKIGELSKTQSNGGEIKDKLNRVSSIIKDYSNIRTEDITRQIIENMIDHITVTPIEDHHAKIEFFLNSGDDEIRIYEQKKRSCFQKSTGSREKTLEILEKSETCRSGNVFFNMFPEQPIKDLSGVSGTFSEVIIFPEQHKTFYRQLRSHVGHSMPVKYTYKLAI